MWQDCSSRKYSVIGCIACKKWWAAGGSCCITHAGCPLARRVPATSLTRCTRYCFTIRDHRIFVIVLILTAVLPERHGFIGLRGPEGVGMLFSDQLAYKAAE